MCREDAFFLDTMLYVKSGSIPIIEVAKHIGYEDGEPKHHSKVRCQRCWGPIRHIEPERIKRLKAPYTVGIE